MSADAGADMSADTGFEQDIRARAHCGFVITRFRAVITFLAFGPRRANSPRHCDTRDRDKPVRSTRNIRDGVVTAGKDLWLT